MQAKSLLLAAFISLGVVTGCDDPEVQDKVLSIMEHGSVSAYAYCYTPTTILLCDSSYSQKVAFKAYYFQDGSSYLKYSRTFPPTKIEQFNYKDLPLRVDTLDENNGLGYFAEISEGVLETRSACPTLGIDYTDTVDISTELICSGFNLEAFGITP